MRMKNHWSLRWMIIRQTAEPRDLNMMSRSSLGISFEVPSKGIEADGVTGIEEIDRGGETCGKGGGAIFTTT